tara:strand:- start:2786 stop:3436 length:651 start_codon:yes stop_codon:yes gene_type:complete
MKRLTATICLTIAVLLGRETHVRILIFAIFIPLFLPGASSAGGVVDVLEVTYRPLMQTKNGRIHNCGIHFSLAVSKDNRVFGVQGSLNEFYFQNKTPSIGLKITVVEAQQGQLVRLKLKSAFLRGKTFSTSSFRFNQASPEFGGWLAGTDMSKSPNLFGRFILSLADKPWIGFNVGGGTNDFTMQLPKPKERGIFKESASCSLQAIKQLQKELGDQ